MRDESEKYLTPKQAKAIAALLAERTYEEAAASAGVSCATLYRWLKEHSFQEEYREARRRAFDGAIARLQATAISAANTLVRNLEAESAGVQVRAAIGILDRAIKAQEIYDLLERVEALEERLELENTTHNSWKGQEWRPSA